MNPPGRTPPGWAWGLAVTLLTLLIFSPVLSFPFFPFWDDDIHVHANPWLHPLTWEGWKAFWLAPYQQLFIPLTYSVWAALAAGSRAWAGLPVTAGPLDPFWFHAANWIFHAGSTALVFLLLRRLLAALPGLPKESRVSWAAAVGAAFFAWHPLQVEPVAWISGLRDVLGGFLALAALGTLFGGDKPGVPRWGAATLLFLGSLAAKPAGVSLPLVAGLLAAVSFGWKPARLAWALTPWLVLAAGWVLLTRHAQSAADLARDLVPLGLRPLVAADALAFYLGKTLVPIGLAADYGRAPDLAWNQGWLWWTWLAPATLLFLLVWFRPLRPFLLPAGIFAAALLPTLGLVPFNFQVVSTVADRYAYLALFGPALALAMVTASARTVGAAVAGTGIVAALAGLSVVRLPLWSEDLRLFAATLKNNPQSWKAMHNFASALDDRGRTAEAEPLMRKVIELRPNSAEAHNDLGVMLWGLGHREEAVAETRRALEIRSTASAARNLVIMEAERQNGSGYLEALRLAVALAPGDRERSRQLAWFLATFPDPALRNGPESLRLAQTLASTNDATPQDLMTLAAAQAESGDFAAARQSAREAVRRLEDAGDPWAHSARAEILRVLESGRPVRSQLFPKEKP